MKREDIKNKLETYKNEGFEKSKEMIKEKKGKIKKFAILTLTGSIVLAGIGAGTAFAFVKSNTKYSQEKLKEIALSKIPGEVVGVKKDIDEDSMSLTYEFKIKDKNNMLNEIELDSKTGAIIDIENHNEYKDHYDNDHDDKDHEDRDSNYEKHNDKDIKANIKYSEEDARKIALEKVSGEVLKVKEEIDEDNNSLVYEFKIKTKDNTIKEVEVDSKMGNIVDIDNHDDDFNLENQNNKADSNNKIESNKDSKK
ncbi:PepSY domain-containing protein [[Eubacterium] tenue]|nr:PepSY domain-containing protein [[Eubacterium] tenue]MBC8632786.1 PepSY domain-containing protein [[Eubacterium] tenue]